MARILSGKELAAKMRQEMQTELTELKSKHDLVPSLSVILVGDDPGSISYVKGKEKACAYVGINVQKYKFDVLGLNFFLIPNHLNF